MDPGRLELCSAIFNGDLEGVKKWLTPDSMEKTSWRGWTVLVFACQFGLVDIVRYMQSLGANMFIKDKQGRTLLHHVRKSVALVELLLDCGLDVNQKDGLGDTPLHTCDPDEWDVVRRLLEAGADIYATNNNNLTPLGKFYRHDISALLADYLGTESVVCKRKNCNCRTTIFVCNYKRSHNELYMWHCVKTICANLPVSPENNICSPHPFMEANEFISRFYGSLKADCEEEYKRLETENVDGLSVSYKSVWYQNQSALRNPSVQQTMTPEHCVRTFPIYGETLRMRLVAGMRRLSLLDRAVGAFEVHVPSLLPECIEGVLGFLGTRDLRSLLVACGYRRRPQSDESQKRPCEGEPRAAKTAKRQ